MDISPKLRIPKIQFTDHMKLKKKEEQSVDILILIGKWIKTLCSQQTNRMRIGSTVEQLREHKELNSFAVLKEEQ